MAGPTFPGSIFREGLVIRLRPHYLERMGLLKDVSVTGGFGDLIAVFRQSEPGERLLPAALAIACTSLILFLFWLDPQVNTYTYVPQEVIYVENWTTDRTDEEILKDRWEIQCLKDELEAKRVEAVKSLGRMSGMDVDAQYMAVALALSERGRGRTGANPNVGCVIVKHGIIIGRGWTQPSGRPHAEEMALAQAGAAAKGADIYVTMEPCAHESSRGPTCSNSIIDAKPKRVIVATLDADERTRRRGIDRLGDAGIPVSVGIREPKARRAMAGFLCRLENARPFVTLKLAMSLDGCIAMADGSSQWITGDRARAHAHLERARSDAILVGAGTARTDNQSCSAMIRICRRIGCRFPNRRR